jgi:hypothetical protein
MLSHLLLPMGISLPCRTQFLSSLKHVEVLAWS